MLRACEGEKAQQAGRIVELERGFAPVTPEVKVDRAPDMDFYIEMAENAKKRIEVLEKENLALRVRSEQKGVDGHEANPLM